MGRAILVLPILLGAALAGEQAKEITNSLGMKLVRIPPGEFMMGSPVGELGDMHAGVGIQDKQRKARITKGFHLGTCEVTREQWKAVMGTEPWKGKLGTSAPEQGKDYPAVCVSWRDAAGFCERLSKREGRRYRLAHEAEWEYACRAGTTTPFHTGETLTAEQANFDPSDLPIYHPDSANAWKYRDKKRGQVAPVASYPPNPWGLYDMHGNVAEWCLWHVGPGRVQPGAIRGGWYYLGPVKCRSAARHALGENFQEVSLGFRVVLDTKGSEALVEDPAMPGGERPKGGRPRR